MISSDPLTVLIELCESERERHSYRKLAACFGSEIESLVSAGALVPAPYLDSIPCGQCDRGHSVELEYVSDIQRHRYFCPEAGLVDVDDADLITHCVDMVWLLGQLKNSIGATGPRNPREIDRGHIWYLGSALTGETKWNLLFARRMVGAARSEALASWIGSQPAGTISLVLSTTLQLPRAAVPSPTSIFIELDEVVTWRGGRIEVNRRSLDAWVRKARFGKSFLTKAEMTEKQVRQIAQARRNRGEVAKSVNAEATGILDEWHDHFPDEEKPGHSTVRKLLSKSEHA